MTDRAEETPVAVLDANVLFSATQRDFFMRAALEKAFQPRWSDRIHEEWMRNLLKKRPDLRRERLVRTRDLMDYHVKGALVHGFEGIEPSLDLPDEDDRHVLALAIKVEAGFIVTANLKDFPSRALGPFGIEALLPDVFGTLLVDKNPDKACRAILKQWLGVGAEGGVDDFLINLSRKGLAETVKRASLSSHWPAAVEIAEQERRRASF